MFVLFSGLMFQSWLSSLCGGWTYGCKDCSCERASQTIVFVLFCYFCDTRSCFTGVCCQTDLRKEGLQLSYIKAAHANRAF